jgi:hypothetical protein
MIGSPASVSLDSLKQYEGAYHGMHELELASVYPIMEGYKDVAAVGLRFNLSDPIYVDAFDLRGSYSPSRSIEANERFHLAGAFRHYDWTVQAKWNYASFYDLVGPTKVGRKGYSAGVTYKHTVINDPPRTLDFTTSLTGWGGLEVLPDAQNVATSAGFDKLVTAKAEVGFKNVRGSLGGVEPETGYRWVLNGTTNMVRAEQSGHGAWRGFPMGYATLDIGKPLPVRHSSLWLRSAAGYSPGSREEPFANFYFGAFGNNWVDYQDAKRYREYAAFPGVELDEIAGTNFVKALLDLNLPPLRFRRVGKPAFYASYVRTSIFSTGLVTNLDSREDRVTAGSIGAQADLRITVLVNQPLMLSFGYARAFLKDGPRSDETMVSLKIL